MGLAINGQGISSSFFQGKEVSAIYFNGNLVWGRELSYLCFTAIEDSFIGMSRSVGEVLYTTNFGGSWGVLNENVPLLAGQRMFVKTDSPSISDSNYNQFRIKGKVKASGDITSMGKMSPYCYTSLFSSCDGLIIPPLLPSTTVSPYCYYAMFDNCTSLISCPELPAINLQEGCYLGMFAACKSLTECPNLPATVLPMVCYGGMFQNCISLRDAPQLSFDTMEDFSCYMMFQGCSQLKIGLSGRKLFIPATPNINPFAVYDMIVDTGGSYRKDPEPNVNYYIE